MNSPYAQRPPHRAFTLTELMVVVAIIAVLTGLLFPAFRGARGMADTAHCVANLHAAGVAIAAYTGDNQNTLPGPLGSSQSGWYNAYTTSNGSLIGLLAPYFGLPAPVANPRATFFSCPAYLRSNPALNNAAAVGSYLVNTTLVFPGLPSVPGWGNTLPPFGYPGSTPLAPLKTFQLDGAIMEVNGTMWSASLGRARTWAITDMDQKDAFAGAGWYGTVPKTLVHGNFRNALFFDWHVGKIDQDGNPF